MQHYHYQFLCNRYPEDMASLQFDGALQGISERQQKFIRDVLEKRGYNNNKVLFEPGSKAGDNYVANVLRITVIVEGDDDFKMIAKIAPQLEALRTVMNTAIMFNNEIIMYEQVLPKFNSLQIEAGVPENEKYKYAQCYGYLSEEPYEVILLEDLKLQEFVMFDRLAATNDDSVLLFLKNIAILHSMSYVLKHREPETYEKCSNRLINMWSLMNKSKKQMDFTEQTEHDALEILDDEQYKKAIRGVLSQTPTFEDQTKKHDNPKHLVIQHGDAWTNNIMFKQNGGKTVDAVMIDYQLSSETSPVADILYFIFICTNHTARSKRYLEWINFYHDQLDRSLSNFGLKANFIYPKDQLDADLKRYSKLFFTTAVMSYNLLAGSPEEAAEMHDARSKFDVEIIDGMQVESPSRVKFKHQLEGLIDSYREFGYIN